MKQPNTSNQQTDAGKMTIQQALAAKRAIDELCGRAAPEASIIWPPPAKADPYDAFLGEAVGIRTVTFSQVGRLVEVHPDSLVLDDAACVMDWGRFAGGAAGTPSEVEPYPQGRVIVGRGAIVDCFAFGGKLPLTQK